jgi:hypothetical protein
VLGGESSSLLDFEKALAATSLFTQSSRQFADPPFANYAGTKTLRQTLNNIPCLRGNVMFMALNFDTRRLMPLILSRSESGGNILLNPSQNFSIVNACIGTGGGR